MPTTEQFPLPYTQDALSMFMPLAGRPWACWLDSAGCGRYDILLAEPVMTLVTRQGITELCGDGQCGTSRDDPLLVLDRILRTRRRKEIVPPFSSGALGYFSYDLARHYASLPELAEDDLPVPEMAIGIYDWAVVVDHQSRSCWLAGSERDWRRWQELSARPMDEPVFVTRGPARSNLGKEEYARRFARVRDGLLRGDCQQVNLAQRFFTTGEGDPFALYQTLRRENPAPFSAWLNFPFAQVMSASPERFLSLQQERVETRPIKGTRPRHADIGQDRQLAGELAASEKDRTENRITVDRLCEELAQVAEPGSIQTPRLFDVESFATVHHLVSTITCTLAAGRSACDLLRSCFPGASISGSPKLRAMEIIEELEPHRRGIYCGSIAYIGDDGSMDSNIAIRTLLHVDGKLCFSAGGGITAGSDTEGEYQECLDKARALHRVLQLHEVQENE